MKKLLLPITLLFTALQTFVSGAYADTANEILVNPAELESKSVSLDVAFVVPVRWASPVPGVAFFHAMTFDKRNQSPGGRILLAVPDSKREAVARRYGVSAEGRKPSTNTLRAILRKTNGPGRHSIWYLDQTEGELSKAISEKAGQIEAFEGKERPDNIPQGGEENKSKPGRKPL